MGCANKLNEWDDRMRAESAKGAKYIPDPTILAQHTPVVDVKIAADVQRKIAFIEEANRNIAKEFLPHRTEEFDKVNRVIERVDRIKSLISPEVSPDPKEKDTKVITLVLPHIPPTCREYFRSDISKDIEKIKNGDPYKTIVVTTERKIPLFATDFKDSGEELSKHIKDYPKDYPEVRVYTPVLPTTDNLKRMLNGDAPLSPWHQKVELHHYEQDPKGPLMKVETELHHEVPHPKEGLTQEERDTYNMQRENIYKMAARAYLGDRLEDFKTAVKL